MAKTAAKKKAASKPEGITAKVEASERVHNILNNSLLNHTVGRLAAVMRQPGTTEPTNSELRFGIRAFTDIAPQNTQEALLATQMVAVHEVALHMLTLSKQSETIAQMEAAGNQAIKLLGVFQQQYAALHRQRRPEQQQVRVVHEHRHIHVNANGQEIPGGGGVVREIEEQPHGATNARALAFTPGQEVLGEDAPRDPVPVTSNSQGAVQNARRGRRVRST